MHFYSRPRRMPWLGPGRSRPPREKKAPVGGLPGLPMEVLLPRAEARYAVVYELKLKSLLESDLSRARSMRPERRSR